MKQAKADLGLALLRGLDETKDKKWLEEMMRYNDHMIRDDRVSYPCFPLVKNKRLRVEVSLMSGETHLVFERRLGVSTRGIRLTLQEYESLRERFPLMQEIIRANQKVNNKLAIEEVLNGHATILDDFYGWKYCRLPLLDQLLLTFKWHEEKGITLIKINRSRHAGNGIWVPDIEQEICLGGGGMEYLMRHLDCNVMKAIEMWKRVVEVANPGICMYSYLDEKAEIEQAVNALLKDDGLNGGWGDSKKTYVV